MPPEFANKVFSVKTDVFSYGVTLWEIVTRTDPWLGFSPSKILLLVNLHEQEKRF